MDPKQTIQSNSTPPIQDVNATMPVIPTHTSPMMQPLETPIETPVDTSIQIEGYEPPPGEGGLLPLPPPPPTGGFNKRIIIIVGGVVLILIILIIALIVALRPTNEPQPIVLTYWGLWDDPVVMQTVIDDYQRDNPLITVQYSMQSPKEYRQRLQAAIGRGEGPDIFRFHNTWVPMLVNELAPIPATIMPPEEYQQTFYPVAQTDLKVNNQYVGIPLLIDGLILYYNAQLLDEAGVAIPTTWEEFESAVHQMTIRDETGAITLAGAALGTAENVEHFSDILGLILYQNSSNPTTVTMPSLSSSEAALALQYYTLYASPPNNVWDASFDNSIVAFAEGKVAFIFAPSWEMLAIQNLNPDLVFGVAPVPQLPGAQPANWATYWVEGVSARSPNQVAAFTFLKYLSSKEVMTKLFAETAKMRKLGVGNPYSRVDLASEMAGNNYLAPIAEEAPTMKSWYLASRTQGDGINERVIGYFRNAVNAINKGSSAAGELPTVSWGVGQVLGEYGISPP